MGVHEEHRNDKFIRRVERVETDRLGNTMLDKKSDNRLGEETDKERIRR